MNLLEISQYNTKRKTLIYKIIGLFSVVRGYNILILIVAQYFAVIFIFAKEKSLVEITSNTELYLIIIATITTVASGYIINSFYDIETDRINKPITSKIDSFISPKSKVYVCFILNTIGTITSFIVSWKAFVFFAFYTFSIWLYSHKLKQNPITRLILSPILSLLPFFAIFVYYQNYSNIIIAHAYFLFLLLLIKELIKDLKNIRGNIINNQYTITTTYGEYFTKILSNIIYLMLLAPIYFLWNYPEIGLMKYYFYLAFVVLFFISIIIWKAQSTKQYLRILNFIKILIVIGVFSLCLMDTSWYL